MNTRSKNNANPKITSSSSRLAGSVRTEGPQGVSKYDGADYRFKSHRPVYPLRRSLCSPSGRTGLGIVSSYIRIAREDAFI